MTVRKNCNKAFCKKNSFLQKLLKMVFLRANCGSSGDAFLLLYHSFFSFRPSSRARRRKGRQSSADHPHSAKTTVSDTELESLNDTKSPIAASLAGGKPYFMSLDSYREAMADDPNANPVDRHNSKERHRR